MSHEKIVGVEHVEARQGEGEEPVQTVVTVDVLDVVTVGGKLELDVESAVKVPRRHCVTQKPLVKFALEIRRMVSWR